MRAVVVAEFGGPERLEIEDAPAPPLPAGAVRIGVEAAGVNRADLLARAGRYHRAGPPPLRLGLEGAGTVLEVGDGVTAVRAGQRVLAWCATNDPGFYAEQAVVPEASVVVLPDAVDAGSAASLPAAWLSAWYCLTRLAEIQEGQTVLVHAGASGVGSAAVQIARDAGARVLVTAGSAEKIAWTRTLGADEGFDTSQLDRGQILEAVSAATGGKGVDAVLDTVGGDTFADSLQAVGYGGRVVALANVALAPSTIDTRDFYPKNVAILGFQITALQEHGYDARADLTELLTGVAERRFTVPVHATFDLRDAADAHRLVESRATLGKVLLTTGA